jgi:hypothetical protein
MTVFAHSRAEFQDLVAEGCGLSVSVRKGELENVERNRDKSLGVTVYIGQRRGNASTSDFSDKAIEQTVQAAYDIARFTAEDPMAGLPDADDLRPPTPTATSTCSTPGPSTASRPHAWPWSARPPRSRPAAASPTARALACRPSKAIFSAPTRAAFAAAMPARATAFRCRPSPRCPAAMPRCSAMRGTAPMRDAADWPRPRPWAATPPSAH